MQVVRIKNRLTPNYDAAQSAGYRDVAINLRLTTLEARRLGVASHVCEVQIILKAFADLKVPLLSNRQRYAVFLTRVLALNHSIETIPQFLIQNQRFHHF